LRTTAEPASCAALPARAWSRASVPARTAASMEVVRGGRPRVGDDRRRRRRRAGGPALGARGAARRVTHGQSRLGSGAATTGGSRSSSPRSWARPSRAEAGAAARPGVPAPAEDGQQRLAASGNHQSGRAVLGRRVPAIFRAAEYRRRRPPRPVIAVT
jgi:hypothetical protein